MSSEYFIVLNTVLKTRTYKFIIIFIIIIIIIIIIMSRICTNIDMKQTTFLGYTVLYLSCSYNLRYM